MTADEPIFSDTPPSSFAALVVAPTFDPPDLALSGDALVKLYAVGYWDGLTAADGADLIRVAAARARREYPDAAVCEVEVRLTDETLRMTWDEFAAWLDRKDRP